MLERLETKYPWLPYVAPFVVFMAITQFFEGKNDNYPIVYIGKVVLVILALLIFRKPYRELGYDKKLIVPSVLIGLVLTVIWIAVSDYIPGSTMGMGERTAYNPFEKISDPSIRMAYIVVRMIGLAAVVPVMEEIFWRNFGLRIASHPQWWKIPIGQFSKEGVVLLTGAFAFSHPEWLAAVIFGGTCAWWVHRTKSIFGCILVHAVTNLALGIYILTTGAWKYW